MSPNERQLYLVLAMAADRRGISFYGDKRIQRILGCTLEELDRARTALIAHDLLAYDGATYQLLTLPPDPTQIASTSREPLPASKTTQGTPLHTKAPARPETGPADQQQRHAMPSSVRHILRDLFGPDSF